MAIAKLSIKTFENKNIWTIILIRLALVLDFIYLQSMEENTNEL